MPTNPENVVEIGGKEWFTKLQCSTSALTLLLRAKSQPIWDSHISRCQNLKNPVPLTKNLVWVIMSAITYRTPKFKTIAKCGVTEYAWNITLSLFSVLLFCDPKFCSRPETKPHNRSFGASKMQENVGSTFSGPRWGSLQRSRRPTGWWSGWLPSSLQRRF